MGIVKGVRVLTRIGGIRDGYCGRFREERRSTMSMIVAIITKAIATEPVTIQ